MQDGKKTLKEQVRDYLFTMIREHRILPGGRFPAQRELARSLKVSPKIAEVVYNEMEAEHLVVRRVGRGTFLAAGAEDFPQIRNASQNIFLLLPTLRNHYFAECAANSELALLSYRKSLRVITSEASPRISDVTRVLIREGVAGIIAMYNPKGLRFFAQKYDIPMVDVRYQPLQARRPSHWKTLLIDIGKSALLLGEHLLKLGHREIYLAGDIPRPDGGMDRRFTILKAFLEKNGCTVHYLPQQHAIPEYPSYEAIGEELADRMLAERLPGTAAIFFNSARAVGAMRELLKRGVRIPEDFSVCGFDEPSMQLGSEPALTHVFHANVMEQAVDLLLSPNRKDVTSIAIDPTLFSGASTSMPRKGAVRP